MQIDTMNMTNVLEFPQNGSDSNSYSSDPPRWAIRDWPWCNYTLPLPPEGIYALATKWIWSTVPVFWIIIGTFGNLLSGIVIFRRYRKLSSTAIYLLSLAFTDTLFLYNEPLRNWLHFVMGIDIRNNGQICCKLLAFLTFASYHMSPWILIAVTLERVISITWPYKVKHISTERNALIVLSSIVLLVFIMDSHLLYGFEIRRKGISTDVTQCYAANGEYSTFFIHQWFWIHFTFGFIIPFFTIIIGNTVVIFGLRKMQSRQKRLRASSVNRIKIFKHTSPNRRPRTTRSLTVMLLLLNTIFFVSQTPLAVYMVYLPYAEDDVNSLACNNITEYVSGAERINFWTSVIHSFAYMNASINFVLYVVSGSKFRQELYYMLSCNTISMETSSRTNTSDVQEKVMLEKAPNQQKISTEGYTCMTDISTSSRRDLSASDISSNIL